MNFEYITEPQSPYEKAVIKAGYRWVRTNEVVPKRKDVSTGKDAAFDPAHLDRLNKHSHSGLNTHLIVEGHLVFRQQLRAPYTLTSDPTGNHEFQVPRGRAYKASSKEGCKFVEAHRCLSPSTAERFMARGSLRAVPAPRAVLADRMEHLTLNPVNIQDRSWPEGWQWPRDDKIRKWLREASFFPVGPPSLFGRDGKFSFKWGDETSDAGEIRARELIVQWFRQEWDPDNLPDLSDVETRGLFETDEDNKKNADS